MLSDAAGMVRCDGIGDRDVAAGEGAMEVVEVLAEPFERTAVEGQIGWVEADLEGAIRLTGHGPRELREGAQQVMEVAFRRTAGSVIRDTKTGGVDRVWRRLDDPKSCGRRLYSCAILKLGNSRTMLSQGGFK